MPKKLSSDETPKVESSEELATLVAPIESVPSEKKTTEDDLCWNCRNNGKTSILESGVCQECGFDKSILYNLELEEKRAIALRSQASAPVKP